MMARRRRTPLTFVAFDAPHVVGESTTHLPYRDRRRLLEALDLQGPSWCIVPSFDAETDDVLAECERLGLEGLVVDGLTRYEAGKRSRALLKMTASRSA